MKKQLLAFVAVLSLCGFASVGISATENVEPRSNVVHWATVVFCSNDADGQVINEVCVGGHTGFVVWKMVDLTLSIVPGSPAMTYLAR